MDYSIESKEDSYGKLLYTVKPSNPRSLKYPIGWFSTEEAALVAYEKALK